MVYVFLAEGFEEIEALAPVDIMRRAGIAVKTVGVTSGEIIGSHGIRVQADDTTDNIELKDLEAIVLPGGIPGTPNLEKNVKVNEFLDFAYKNNLLIAAICAAPSILGHKGFLKDREAICYPGFEKELDGAVISKKSVVKDDNIITAKGAGVALEFGLALVSAIKGDEISIKIKESMQCIQ